MIFSFATISFLLIQNQFFQKIPRKIVTLDIFMYFVYKLHFKQRG